MEESLRNPEVLLWLKQLCSKGIEFGLNTTQNLDGKVEVSGSHV